jgi:PKD repeat protein
MREETEEYGFKLFYLCYTLGDLVDRDAESSRYNVILKILDFFGYDLPEGYMVANFIKEQELSGDDLVVQFTDISLIDEDFSVETWEWDFDNDGTIDSYEQNPQWTFTDAGTYDVKLIISGEVNSDTLLREGFVKVNGGFLIYDGDPGWQGYSGPFIRDYFESHGNFYTYTGDFPESLLGYDAAFISLGAMSEYQLIVTELNNLMADVITEYLMNGGYVYLDGGDALGYDQQSNTELLSLFGIESADDGGYNPVDSLGGFPDALTSDMLFTSSNQQGIGLVDWYEPAEGAVPALRESGYGIVAVQNEGEHGQRTFCSSYALIALDDGEDPNTREELLRRICAFFDIYTGVDVPVNSGSVLMVYPNPVRDQFTIRGTGITGQPMMVNIFSITGECLDQRQFNQGGSGEFNLRLNLGCFPAGMYFVQVQAGSQTVTRKIIKL